MTEIRRDLRAEDIFRYMNKLDFPAQYRLALAGTGRSPTPYPIP